MKRPGFLLAVVAAGRLFPADIHAAAEVRAAGPPAPAHRSSDSKPLHPGPLRIPAVDDHEDGLLRGERLSALKAFPPLPAQTLKR